MKKRSLAFAIILFNIFMLGIGEAITLDMKSSYDQSETVIAEVKGSLISPINAGNVKLKRNGYIDIGFEKDVVKIGEKYYLWFITPGNKANYTLVIEGISTYVGGQAAKIDYLKEFTTTGNVTDYSIKPGAIVSSKNFYVDAQVYGDSVISADVDFPSQRMVSLNPGQNRINFDVSSVSGNQIKDIKIGKYVVPAQIVKESVNSICGNNVIESGESCECGSDGICGTADDSMNGTTCLNQGYDSGNITCNSCISFNVSSCVKNGVVAGGVVCGDNNIEGSEVCECGSDGICGTADDNVIGKSCLDAGFAFGELRCGASCLSYNRSLCSASNGVRNISFRVSPIGIQAVVPISSRSPIFRFMILNNGDERINSIGFNYNREMMYIYPEGISLEPNETGRFNLSIRTISSTPINQSVNITADGIRKEMSIYVNFTTNATVSSLIYTEEPPNGGGGNNNGGGSLVYCSDLPEGKVCETGKTCVGSVVSTFDQQNCCSGECRAASKSGGNSWLGYVIMGVLVLVLLFIFLKYRKTKPNPGNIMAKTIMKAEKGMP